MKKHLLVIIITISAVILFACSSLRHALFQSKAFDLGIYDQVVYLISQGITPISSILEFHHLGNHAAWSVYFLALLYKIYPNVHWLLLVQAIALSVAALPLWHLAYQASLKETQATTIVLVYLLYPLIFNINLFDFHPEVMALPAIFVAILAARNGRFILFCLAILFILGCKAALSLTVAAMGIWLLFFEKNRFCGFFALFAGVSWFLIATQLIIPSFSGKEVAAVGRYDFLGDSVLEIISNLILQPGIVLSRIFTLANLNYLLLLLSPLIWGLSPKYLTALVPAIPALSLNLITDHQAQKDLLHQYSLPILPFLLLAVVTNMANGGGLLRTRKAILLWSIVAFLALAKFGYFGSRYLQSLDTWQATREAIALVNTNGGVLTPTQIVPHLSHRPLIKMATKDAESIDLDQFDYILLNLRHPGWKSSKELAFAFALKVEKMPQFKLIYQKDDVLLFNKKG